MIYFDKSNLKTLRYDIEKALATVAKCHNIDIALGNITFSEDLLAAKMTAVTKSQGVSGAETVNVKWKADFMKKVKTDFAFRNANMSVDHFGKKVTVLARTGTYTIVGARPRKSQVIVKSHSNNKYYVYTPSMLVLT